MIPERMALPGLRPCPICGHATSQPLHAMRFALPVGSPLPAAYNIVACAMCGFVYADTTGNREDYDRYYAEFSHYEDPAIATGGGEQAFDRQRLAETAAWIAAHVATDARVLDIGCGNGGLLQALRDLGFTHLAGMDPSAGCVARLQARGFEALQGWLGGRPAGQTRFDFVILSHVLEHVLEPRAALAALRDWLTPAGYVYVETPDAERYAEFPSVPFYYFDSEHINHFERFGLENLARSTGFLTHAAGTKTLALMGGHAYPAVYALLAVAESTAPVLPNDAARAAVTAYVAQSTQASHLPDGLLNALAAGRPIALWGAGSQAQRLLQDEAMAAARIIAVVDGDCNKQGSQFAGCTVAIPSVGLIGLPEDCVVVIAAALVAEQILTIYRAMGLPYEYVIN